jgi:hypothetical protein
LQKQEGPRRSPRKIIDHHTRLELCSSDAKAYYGSQHTATLLDTIKPGNDEPEVSSRQRRSCRDCLCGGHVLGETTNEVPGEALLHIMLKGIKSRSAAIHPDGGIVKFGRFQENL